MAEEAVSQWGKRGRVQVQREWGEVLKDSRRSGRCQLRERQGAVPEGEDGAGSG